MIDCPSPQVPSEGGLVHTAAEIVMECLDSRLPARVEFPLVQGGRVSGGLPVALKPPPSASMRLRTHQILVLRACPSLRGSERSIPGPNERGIVFEGDIFLFIPFPVFKHLGVMLRFV
jgi:hypothetical protein